MIQTVSINPPERAYTKLTISGKASAARTESRERVPSSYRMMCGLGTVR